VDTLTADDVLPQPEGFAAALVDLVAPQVQNVVAPEEFDAVEIAVVDVLMEFQPKENMFLQQHDLEPENSERAIILFVPPVSQQFKEINRALDAIQATATAGLVADLDVQMPSKKRSWDSAFTDKKSADEPPVILHLDRKIVPISSIKVIDNMKPPTIFVVQSSDVGKDLVFSAMPP
jgi:23S rRNA A2030 N6-methylase RlmJ